MRASLFWKLGLPYLLLLLAILAGMNFFAGEFLRQQALGSAEERLQSLANLARSRPPQFDNPAALQSWAQWLASGGARVTVLESDGSVEFDSAPGQVSSENFEDQPEFQQAIANGEGKSVRSSRALGGDVVYEALRFDRSGAPPIVIRLATPPEAVDSSLSALRWRVAGVSLAMLALGVVLILFFARGFSSRLERLEQFSRRVAEGDFRPLTGENGHDEIGKLARSLNETAANLNTTIRSLTAERNRSAAILRSMAEGVAVVDSRERMVFYNGAFAEIWGIDPAEYEGKSTTETMRQPGIIELTRQALRGQKTLTGEVSLGGPRVRSFAVTAAPVPVPAEGLVAGATENAGRLGAVLVLHEITELRRLEQVRKDFVANVSHELRTPLTAIQGFAETLLGGALDDHKNNRRFVEIIRSHAARLSRLTDDLLKLSRIEAGKLELEFRPVGVAELVESSVEAARVAAEPKQLSVSVRLPENLPAVRGDARLLREVLRNLLDNAVQYTPPGGRIEVQAEQKDSVLILTVADTGIGIPRADQPRIFERFYRVDAARSREVGGTGLGLAIARHIVQAHGGEIHVESTVGQGSQFYFSIPLADEA